MSDQQQGTPIAFGDVRAGDVVRVTRRVRDVLISYEGPVSDARPDDPWFMVGDGVFTVANGDPVTVTLLSRPPAWQPLDLSAPLHLCLGRRYKFELSDGSSVMGVLRHWHDVSTDGVQVLIVWDEAGVSRVVRRDKVVAMWGEEAGEANGGLLR